MGFLTSAFATPEPFISDYTNNVFRADVSTFLTKVQASSQVIDISYIALCNEGRGSILHCLEVEALLCNFRLGFRVR